MNIDGRMQRGNTTAPRYGNAARDSMRNFQKIFISLRSVRPLIKAPSNLADNPLIPIGIESFD